MISMINKLVGMFTARYYVHTKKRILYGTDPRFDDPKTVKEIQPRDVYSMYGLDIMQDAYENQMVSLDKDEKQWLERKEGTFR